MISRGFILLVAGAALLEGAAPHSPTSPPIVFVAVTRTERDTWLLDGSSGGLWSQVGEAPPLERLRLVRKASGLSWGDAKGLAALPDGWLVAGRRGRLERYALSGEFVREIDVADRVADVVVSGPVLWAVPYVVPGPVRHLLRSTDRERFARLTLQPHGDDPIGTGAPGIVDGAGFLAVDRDGGVVFARLFGGPTVFRVRPDGSRRAVSLEYRRSARRDALRRYAPREDDLESYSRPARDLLVTRDGGLLVLRNVEDVRTPGGFRSKVGTMIDRFDPDGRHEASAELCGSARFIARADGTRVVCLTDDGRVLTTQLGPPRRGGVE